MLHISYAFQASCCAVKVWSGNMQFTLDGVATESEVITAVQMALVTGTELVGSLVVGELNLAAALPVPRPPGFKFQSPQSKWPLVKGLYVDYVHDVHGYVRYVNIQIS